jgi:uncharacterized membrane protein YheB (UPF0754 family)
MFDNQIRSYKNAAKINDIIPEDFVKTLKITNDVIKTRFNRGSRVKKQFAQKIFFRFLSLMIDDCIENNSKFVSPSRYWFAVYIKQINNGNRNRILKNRKIYTDVDLIASDFKIYEFVLRSSYLKGYNQNRRIRIGYKKYKELVSKVNKGSRYRE